MDNNLYFNMSHRLGIFFSYCPLFSDKHITLAV